MKKKSKWVACAALCADGTKCGRSARADVRFCHIHLGQQQRAAGIAPPDPNQFVPTQRTPQELLEKIARDDKHSGQLQALKILLEQQRCGRCAAREEEQRMTDDLWERMTDEQSVPLRELLGRVNTLWTALKPIVATQPRRDLVAEDDAKMAQTPVVEPPPMPPAVEETSDEDSADVDDDPLAGIQWINGQAYREYDPGDGRKNLLVKCTPEEEAEARRAADSD